MQKIPCKLVPPVTSLKPPIYKPGPAPAVLQAKSAAIAAAQPRVKVPPVFHPDRQPLVQAKLAPLASPTGQIIQRMEQRTTSRKQQKVKEAQAGTKRSEQRKQDKTLRNASGYGGFEDKKVVKAFIDDGGVIKGHLSDDSNSKASGHTTSGLQNLREFKANHEAKNPGTGKEEEFHAPKEKKQIVRATLEALENDAIKAWNLAVSTNNNGLEAMRNYLQKRLDHSPGVTDEMVNQILENWVDYPDDRSII